MPKFRIKKIKHVYKKNGNFRYKRGNKRRDGLMKVLNFYLGISRIELVTTWA
jgi:hypothetical protein